MPFSKIGLVRMKFGLSQAIGSKRLVVALICAVLVMLGFIGKAHAASAPDLERDGSSTLTIHKFIGHNEPLPGSNGLALSPEDEPPFPLAGAEFALKQVVFSPELDLSSNAGWKRIEELYKSVGSNPGSADILSEPDVVALRDAGIGTTDSAGVLKFSGLKFGLYYVEETYAPEGFFETDAFLVALPLTHPTELDGWIYDVHVYPKDRNGPEKEVVDFESADPNHLVTWKLYGSLPVGEVTGFKFRDVFDGRLDYQGPPRVTLADFEARPETTLKTFKEGVDYRVDVLPAKDGAGRPTKKVEVTFLPAGLETLSAVRVYSHKVQVELDTFVKESGYIENVAEMFDTDYDIEQDTPSGKTRPVATKWGAVNVRKVDADDPNLALAGAEFQLYYSHVNDFSTASTTGYKATTGEGGIANLGPLRYSDFAGNEDIDSDDEAYWYFWLVETKAPTGYHLASGEIPVQITFDNAAEDDTVTIVVKNTANPTEPGNPGGSLAVTGATVGVFALIALIALIIGSKLNRRNA